MLRDRSGTAQPTVRADGQLSCPGIGIVLRSDVRASARQYSKEFAMMKLFNDHNREEYIRTIDSIISIVLQVLTLTIQCFGLWWIMHHPH